MTEAAVRRGTCSWYGAGLFCVLLEDAFAGSRVVSFCVDCGDRSAMTGTSRTLGQCGRRVVFVRIQIAWNCLRFATGSIRFSKRGEGEGTDGTDAQ